MPRRGSGSQRKRPSLPSPSPSGDETRSPHRPEETLTEISREAVGKLLRRANKVGSSKKKNKPEVEPEINGSQVSEQILQPQTSEVGHCGGNSIGNVSAEKKRNHVSLGQGFLDEKEELHDSDWEDGAVAMDDRPVTVELNVTPDSAVRKQIRRASAEDKELAELVHKAHLLCLLARGRLIDSACDDPLIQASLLSLLPAHLLQLSNVTELTSKALHPLIVWFHDNFHVKNCANEDKSPHFALASALESHEGSPEEIAALAVALFRALNLTARFVSILDVASIKPVASGSSKGIFSTSTPMISKLKLDFKSPKKSLSSNEREVVGESSLGRSLKSKKACTTSHMTRSKDPPVAKDLNQSVTNSPTSKAHDNNPESYAIDKSHKPKRKGDLEYEMQLEMALSATAVECSENKMESGVNAESSNVSCPSKRMKIIKGEESSTSPQVISTAVGSMKVGSPLYWAEIYCSQENLTGKWVHIDAVNMIIDGEDKVEAMVAACKTSLRYVVAFAGQGAKDVTRRYCMKWYKTAPQRVNSTWWDSVLAPLRDLESGATEGVVLSRTNQIVATEANMMDSSAPSRSSLEDIELETRALTEPLPTNQQAYKSHLLYAIEKWLTKYQVLHPKGPILGFCSGHPVYPRTCVQTVKTKERWLREGLQVKPNEHPVKVLKCSIKPQKVQDSEADDNGCSDSKENIKLYGKWQLEPLNLPHAVNGIVPKNERGQVEVWSEKCLPPGTVHLRLPKAFYVAKRLEIDYAPAMVGFEFRNGRSYPVFDGIVVCAEFKDALLEAYAEEEERRQADEKRRDEAQALNRWYQLLSSIVTRQRLNNRYNSHLSSEMPSDVQCMNDNVSNATACGSSDENQNPRHHQVEKCDADFDASLSTPVKDHEHVFLKEYESFDKGTSLLTKRCQCGFSVQVEEL